MRGIVARRLRKEALEISERTNQKKKRLLSLRRMVNQEGKLIKTLAGNVRWEGPRRVYQDLKKTYKEV